MSTACASCSPGLRLCLVVLLALSVLSGCAERAPLQPEDVAGHLWLRTVNGSRTEGFFAGSEGQLLLIDNPALSGVTWSLQEDRLLLELQDDGTGKTLIRMLSPLMDGKTLLLIPEEGQPADGFARSALQEPLFRKRYQPIYLAGAAGKAGSPSPEPVYLQFAPEETTLHGYGGVNNFHGRYSRHGSIGFKIGPLASTMMSGPSMDYERQLLQALDRVDSFLVVDDELLFFQGNTLLISLQLF